MALVVGVLIYKMVIIQDLRLLRQPPMRNKDIALTFDTILHPGIW